MNDYMKQEAEYVNDNPELEQLFDTTRRRYLDTQQALIKIAQEAVAAGKEWDENHKKDLSPEQAHTFLEEAAGVLKSRAESRDTPGGERTAGKIANVFNALTRHDLTEADVWTILLILKMVRSRNGKYNRDDYVDMASYSSLLGEHESMARRLNA